MADISIFAPKLSSIIVVSLCLLHLRHHLCDVTEMESDGQQACELRSEQLSSQPCPMFLVAPATSLSMLLISVCFSEPRLCFNKQNFE